MQGHLKARIRPESMKEGKRKENDSRTQDSCERSASSSGLSVIFSGVRLIKYAALGQSGSSEQESRKDLSQPAQPGSLRQVMTAEAGRQPVSWPASRVIVSSSSQLEQPARARSQLAAGSSHQSAADAAS